MRRTEMLAYTAGIIDGEGCIGLYLNRSKRQKSGYTLRVTVRNTNEWLIQWLRFTYGGYLYSSSYHSTQRNKNWKPQWQWIICDYLASEFLQLIYPYLQLKKPQADIAVKFQAERPGSGYRRTEKERAVAEAQRIVMARLNRKGIGVS